MNRFVCTMLFSLMAAACSGAQPAREDVSAAPPSLPLEPVPNGTQLFEGPAPVRVELVRVRGDGETDALIRVSGTGSELDGLILPYRYEDDWDRRHYFVTLRHGFRRQYVMRERAAGGAVTYLLAPPNQRDTVRIREISDGQVDVVEILKAFQEATTSGAIERFSRFDRQREVERHEGRVADVRALAMKSCGFAPESEIVWDSLEDASLLADEFGVSEACGGPYHALTQLCEHTPEIGARLAEVLERVRCRFDGRSGDPAVTLDQGALSVAFGLEETFTRKPTTRALGNVKIPSANLPLADLIAVMESHLCTDDAGKLVGVSAFTPSGDQRVIYGDAESLRSVRPWTRLGRGEFFDPREPRADAGAFGGVDYQYVSAVAVEAETCELRCGERRIALTPLSAESTVERLQATPITRAPAPRRAHALLRDSKRYFYVDKGWAPDSVDYRVFMGPRGRLAPLEMVNIIDDSEGTVFETKTGTLRLNIEGDRSSWTRGDNTRPLKVVPVNENLELIYGGLGVYLGQPLGTPCDVF